MSKLRHLVKLHTWAVLAIVIGGAGPARAQGDGYYPPPKRDPVNLDFGALAGAGIRTDDEAAYTLTQRTGLLFGFSLMLSPIEPLGLGIAYEHLDLGHASTDIPGVAYAEVYRDLNTLWLDARVRPLVGENGAVHLTVGPGLSWQSADASGTVFDQPTTSPTARLVECEGSDSAAVSVRGSLGGEMRLAGPMWLGGALTVEGAALSSDPLDGCVYGAGAPFIVSPRATLAYRLDVSDLVR